MAVSRYIVAKPSWEASGNSATELFSVVAIDDLPAPHGTSYVVSTVRGGANARIFADALNAKLAP